MVDKKCQHCSKIYSVIPSREKKTKFCSSRCNMLDKHKKYGHIARERAKLSVVGNKYRKGISPWNKLPDWIKNCVHCKEDFVCSRSEPKMKFCNKECSQKYHSRDNHWNWKGGITEENRTIRHSKEYKEWRMKVLSRDRFTCTNCGYRSVKKRDIRADHIKPFSRYPELRFDVSNGRTLCVPCDFKVGWQNFTENNPRSNEK